MAKPIHLEIKTEMNCGGDYLRVPNNAYFCEEKEIFVTARWNQDQSQLEMNTFAPCYPVWIWLLEHNSSSNLHNSKVYNRVLDDFNVEMFCSNS